MFGSAAATPIPPTSCPFLKIGTPPGLTASASESARLALPVVMPIPGDDPSIRVAGGIVELSPGAKLQARFEFSIPYRAAFALLITPGGKWIPLMNRTVREESGAW